MASLENLRCGGTAYIYIYIYIYRPFIHQPCGLRDVSPESEESVLETNPGVEISNSKVHIILSSNQFGGVPCLVPQGLDSPGLLTQTRDCGRFGFSIERRLHWRRHDPWGPDMFRLWGFP